MYWSHFTQMVPKHNDKAMLTFSSSYHIVRTMPNTEYLVLYREL